ncbi:hypothetical protein OAO01_03350 [Oligoflexia bacterium]|nr:hypothetical protein [Oligoflexia bacterium]
MAPSISGNRAEIHGPKDFNGGWTLFDSQYGIYSKPVIYNPAHEWYELSHLVLNDPGVDVGLPFLGTAPDIGALEVD